MIVPEVGRSAKQRLGKKGLGNILDEATIPLWGAFPNEATRSFILIVVPHRFVQE
jgi:hypothetical protein